MNKGFSFFTILSLALLQSPLFAEGEGGGSQQGFMQTILMFAIAALFFYIILWRPEQKRRKALEQQRENLKKGDRVTAMGIVGTVDKIEEHTVILKMIDGNRIEVVAAAITDVVPPQQENKEENKA